MRSNTSAYSNGGICNPTPWCSPLPVMLSSSMRGTSMSGIDRLWASCTASVSRSSLRVPCAIYRAVAGTRACKHSITGLRPTTSSVLALRSCRPWSRRWRSSLRLWAAWYTRSSAFGVGPLPRRPRRRAPPDPFMAPFLLVLRIPGRFLEFPDICDYSLIQQFD